jgi:uncharacterized protein YjbJ (UPF0337 family)
MTKDQLDDQAKKGAGNAQEADSKPEGSTSQEAMGAPPQVEGKIQKGYGSTRDAGKDSRDAWKAVV